MFPVRRINPLGEHLSAQSVLKRMLTTGIRHISRPRSQGSTKENR